MDIVLDQIAIWKPCGSKHLMARETPLGQRYRDPGSPIYQSASKPLVRYAKDYEIDKIAFCLFVRTYNRDSKAVEAALDDIAKNITKEEALKASANGTMDNFEYTPYLLTSKIGEKDK